MTKIRDLVPEIDKESVDKLQREKITTVEALWNAIGQDYEKGIMAVAARTQVARENLEQILIRSTFPAKRRFPWREVIVAVIGLVILVLVIGRVVALFGPDPFSSNQVIIKAGLTGVQAFRPLTADDLDIVQKPAANNTYGRKEDVIDHYLLQPLPGGQVILKNQLSSIKLNPDQLKNQKIVTLALTPDSINANVQPGASVLVLLSPHNVSGTPAPTGTDVNAFVLQVESKTSGTVVTLAIPDNEYQRFRDLFGSSDIRLSTVIQ